MTKQFYYGYLSEKQTVAQQISQYSRKNLRVEFQSKIWRNTYNKIFRLDVLQIRAQLWDDLEW
jgi:hypothetical protein